ncbi:MAG: hypothetical protein HYX27_02745 [Acidobacteria bacterium]|nr:hypothetical protein [Acidobacteriota bacterium]
MPPHAKRYFDALGDRVFKSGKERSTVRGSLEVAGAANEDISWTWEFPGKLRLLRAAGKGLIVFDPARSSVKNLDDTNDDLLEVLSADTTETFFDNLQRGFTPRFLGAEFRVKGKSGFGSLVDIYEHAVPVAARSQRGMSVKHYMFDSATGLLSKVSYQRTVAGKMTQVSTELSQYVTANGYLAPQRLTRYHQTQKRFQLDIQDVQWLAGVLDNLFEESR